MRLVLFCLALAACGGDTTPANTNQDMTVGSADMRDAFFSTCGKPGDTGNSLGVGKFCSALSDCSGNSSATVCARLGDPNSYFCTFSCTSGGASTQCGDHATCQCQGSQCGCFPDSCM